MGNGTYGMSGRANELSPGRREFLKYTSASLLVVASGAASLRAVSAAEAEASIVTTTHGRIKGLRSGDSYVFKGVPYARTTQRLAPPAAPESWTDVRDAVAFGPRAWQVSPMTGDMNETCQMLNLWTPALDNRKRPVMVWLHGGGFMNGSANSDVTDGTDLNRTGDVVVVTLNHRLGAFGFLQVGDESGAEHGASGCAGMLDLIAALQWVRDNIDRFGGDPANVTIFGESGGGGKVLALMTMPGAKGLFHKAIVQSGALLRTAVPLAEGVKTTHEILSQLNLSPAQWRQLLDVPPEQLLKAQSAVLARLGTPGSGGSTAQRPFSPVINGREFPEQPFDPNAPAVSADVPLMIGTNKEESRTFFAGTPQLYALDAADLPGRLRPILREDTDAALSLYRRTRPQASATDLYFAITTAQMYWYTSTRAAERKARQGRAPAYMYQYAYEGTQTAGNPPVALKSGHATEIPFVFAHPRPRKDNEIPAHERELAAQMSQAWIAFARSGDPNHTKLPHWPAYTADQRQTMIFDVTSKVVSDPHPEERMFWQQVLRS